MANKWLAALAAVLLCGCGGLDMAATVREVYYPQQEATYDKITGAYTCTRVYQVTEHNPMRTLTDSAISIEVADGDGPVPPYDTTFTIPHVEDNSIAITMVPVARRVVKLINDPNNEDKPVSQVIVDYEGHYTGDAGVAVIREELDMGTRSEKAYWDINGNPIGPKGEGEMPMGTTRVLPNTLYHVTCNVAEADYDTYFVACQTNVGKVNEDGWTPSQVAAIDAMSGPGGASEGQFLYLGAQWMENRDGSFTIVHTFDIDEGGIHRLKWYYAKGATATPAGGSVHVITVKDGAIQENVIYTTGSFSNLLL